MSKLIQQTSHEWVQDLIMVKKKYLTTLSKLLYANEIQRALQYKDYIEFSSGFSQGEYPEEVGGMGLGTGFRVGQII